MRLTAKTYTDAGLLPVADAVLSLPSLTPNKAADSQIDSQTLFREGHALFHAGTKTAKEGGIEAAPDQQDRQAVATAVTKSPKNGKSGQNRIRTCEGVSQQIYSLLSFWQFSKFTLRNDRFKSNFRVWCCFGAVSKNRPQLSGESLFICGQDSPRAAIRQESLTRNDSIHRLFTSN